MAQAPWISLIVTSAISITVLYWLVHRKRRVRIPNKWKQVGKVENIVMYPLKSGTLKTLNEAKCTETGLQELDNTKKISLRDRCFVMYNQKFVPLKLLANKLAVMISVESIDLDTIVFNAPRMDSFSLKLSSFSLVPRKVQLSSYGSIMEVIDCGDEISEWLSLYLLGTCDGFRLGYFAENLCRRRGAIEILKNDSPKLLSVYKPRDNDSGTLANLASYMVVSAETIADVNTKLPVEDRFEFGNLRPNIVISGCEKYAEDNWNWIKIGNRVVLKVFKPCTRCLMVTINPDTGDGNKNQQPLKLLKSYRTIKQLRGHDIEGNSPVLGTYLGLYVPGNIKLGDPVYVDSSEKKKTC